jgi:hypothetical protein
LCHTAFFWVSLFIKVQFSKKWILWHKLLQVNICSSDYGFVKSFTQLTLLDMRGMIWSSLMKWLSNFVIYIYNIWIVIFFQLSDLETLCSLTNFQHSVLAHSNR